MAVITQPQRAAFAEHLRPAVRTWRTTSRSSTAGSRSGHAGRPPGSTCCTSRGASRRLALAGAGVALLADFGIAVAPERSAPARPGSATAMAESGTAVQWINGALLLVRELGDSGARLPWSLHQANTDGYIDCGTRCARLHRAGRTVGRADLGVRAAGAGASGTDPAMGRAPRLDLHGAAGAVAFVDRMNKAGWTYEIRSRSWLVAAGVGICRIPLPA
jgi:hypothetical protein